MPAIAPHAGKCARMRQNVVTNRYTFVTPFASFGVVSGVKCDAQKRNPGEPLRNGKHEAFCIAISEGMSGAAAYRATVSRSCSAASALQSASRLLADVKVSSRVAELRKQTGDMLWSLFGYRKETLMRILIEIIETPAGELDDRNRITQRVRRGRYGKSFEMPSKLDAVKLLAQLAGWFSQPKEEERRSRAEEIMKEILDSAGGFTGLPRYGKHADNGTNSSSPNTSRESEG